MFTGIIEETGHVVDMNSGETSGELRIEAKKILENTKVGDSIAVNGVCLTVTKLYRDGFTADVMPVTLRRSNLGKLNTGDPVNLERAIAADGRFGGHIVSGHIDGIGFLHEKHREGNAVWVTIVAPKEILRLIVEKGSIAIDGISLTVAKLNEDSFCVSIIPHTGEETTLTRFRKRWKHFVREKSLCVRMTRSARMKAIFSAQHSSPRQRILTLWRNMGGD